MPNVRDLGGSRRQIDIDIRSWVPDAPPYANPGFPNCENVYPSDLGFYRPLPQTNTDALNTPKTLVPALTNIAGELFGARNPADNTTHFYVTGVDTIGNTQHFFKYRDGTDLWEDVTPVGGRTRQTDAYGRYATYGTQIYVAYGIADEIMAKDISDVNPFVEVSTTAPRAKDIAIVRGFLVAVNTIENGSTSRTRVSWSAADDPTGWIDPIADPIGALSVLRGRANLENGGRLQRIVPGVTGADAIIFGQSKIWRMTFIGAPKVWDFQIVEEREGTISPASVVSNGSLIYFYGLRGWMVFDGISARPIGAGKVNRAFIDALTLDGRFRWNPAGLSNLEKGISAAISGEPFSDRLVFFAYRSDTQATTENLETDTAAVIETDTLEPLEATISSLFNNKLLIYNELTGEWGNGNVGLQSIGQVQTFGTLSDNPQIVGVDEDFNLVRFNRLETRAAFIETIEVRSDVNARVTVRSVWPYVDSDTVKVSLLSREKLSDVQVQSAPRQLEEDASVPVFESGRFVALRLDFELDDRWHSGLQGVTAEFADQGAGSVGA